MRFQRDRRALLLDLGRGTLRLSLTAATVDGSSPISSSP